MVSRVNQRHLDSIIPPGCFWLLMNDSVTLSTPFLDAIEDLAGGAVRLMVVTM